MSFATSWPRWASTRPVAASIDGWFFAHAGNTQGMSAAQLAQTYQTLFDTKGVPHFSDPFLTGSSSLLEAKSWWFGSGQSTSTNVLDFDLGALPAHHIVFGHDPGGIDFPDDPMGNRLMGEMVSRYDGRIFLIDVGMSYAVGYSSGSLLRIVPGSTESATQVSADGTTLPLWP